MVFYCRFVVPSIAGIGRVIGSQMDLDHRSFFSLLPSDSLNLLVISLVLVLLIFLGTMLEL